MTNPHAEAWKQFEGETREHQLTVLHDDGGGYRHLRMANPETRAWSWDVVTWPFGLAFTGNIGIGCILRRDADMLAWIGFQRRRYSDGALHISPGHWAVAAREIKHLMAEAEGGTGGSDWRMSELKHHWLLTCYALATTAEAWAKREGLIS